MSKFKLIVLIFLVISLVIVLGSLFIKFFAPNLLSRFQGSGSQEIIRTDGTVRLPIDIDDPAVFATTLSYTFEGNVKELKRDGEDTILITDLNLKGLPTFIITPKTTISYLDSNSRFQLAKLADLKPAQKVRVVTVYGLKLKSWYVVRVSILVPSLPRQAPPSATLR